MAFGTAPSFQQREPTALLSATTTASGTLIPGSGDDARVANNSSSAVRLAFGYAVADAVANCVAPTTSAPAMIVLVFPGEVEIFGITSGIGAVAAMMVSGTGSVEVTRGDGG